MKNFAEDKVEGTQHGIRNRECAMGQESFRFKIQQSHSPCFCPGRNRRAPGSVAQRNYGRVAMELKKDVLISCFQESDS